MRAAEKARAATRTALDAALSLSAHKTSLLTGHVINLSAQQFDFILDIF
jgi:hypothetical protein